MPVTVNAVDLKITPDADVSVESVLVGEIAGLATRLVRIPAGLRVTLAPQPSHAVLAFVVSGATRSHFGDVDATGGVSFDGPAALVPRPQQALTIEAPSGPACVLEIALRLTAAEVDEMAASDKTPYSLLYSAARTYGEAIKSAKTVSRTILPTGIIPRFAMGSVETTGPDAVGAHRHPMLEQLFFGLPGCDCAVSADDAVAPLRQGTLMHIPLGSMHGVTVEDGRLLHYLWVDAFLDRSGESWISDMHKDNE